MTVQGSPAATGFARCSYPPSVYPLHIAWLFAVSFTQRLKGQRLMQISNSRKGAANPCAAADGNRASRVRRAVSFQGVGLLT
jgi:hypothetical protein